MPLTLPEINAEAHGQRMLPVAGINADQRTVDLAFSSEYDGGERPYGIEILDHSPGACDLDRLRDSGALLVNHDTSDQVGVVVSAHIGADRIGRATVRFGNSPRATEIFDDVVAGIRKHVSVGYRALDFKHKETRANGVDVFLITSWVPHEISIVPVPFDHSIGVGRNLKSPAPQMNHFVTSPQILTQLERTLSGRNAAPLPRNAIADGLRMARNAVAQAGQNTAGAMVYLNLSDVMPASPAPSESRSYGAAVTARPAGEIMTFSSEVYRASRVIRAGANLIQIADAPAPVENDIGLVGWYKRETKFIVVKPATFGNVADGANVTASPLPILAADIDLGESAAQAIHFKISRDMQKAVTDETLSFEISRSLTLGLAQLADKVLLDAIAATNPGNYTLAAAAASGAHFHELRAIIGRNATGGVVNAAGDLTAAGLPGALTDQTAFTFAGIFNRAAIAVEREVRLMLKRTDLMGNLEVTCFVNLQAVLPSPATFWKVAA